MAVSDRGPGETQAPNFVGDPSLGRELYCSFQNMENAISKYKYSNSFTCVNTNMLIASARAGGSPVFNTAVTLLKSSPARFNKAHSLHDLLSLYAYPWTPVEGAQLQNLATRQCPQIFLLEPPLCQRSLNPRNN